MIDIQNIWLIEHKQYLVRVDSIGDRIALSLLSNWLSVVSTSQLEIQQNALRTLFDNAEEIARQKEIVVIFVGENPLSELQGSVLWDFTFGILALWLSIKDIAYSDHMVMLTVIKDDAYMILKIDTDGKIHSEFYDGSHSSFSLEGGWIPNSSNPSFDNHFAKEFKL